MKQPSFILFIIGIFVLAAVGCKPIQTGEGFVQEVGSKTLFEFAKSHSGANQSLKLKDGVFPIDQWPSQFKDVGLAKIQPYFDGVQFVLKTGDKVESGVYVDASKTNKPDSGSGITFKEIEPGIFWFEQKVRKLSKRAQEKAQESAP